MSAWDWSVTPDRNAFTDPTIRAQDGASARVYPELIRAVMTAVRAVLDDIGGAIATTGTANAYTVATRSGVTTLRSGISLLIQADRDNTAACTLNVDGTGPKPWRQAGGTDMIPGVVRAARFYNVVYDQDLGIWRSNSPAIVSGDVLGLSDALTGKLDRSLLVLDRNPTVADIPDGTIRAHKNSATGKRSIWVNDGGTLIDLINGQEY